MESNLNVIGNRNSIIYYNLNEQFSNLKKIIITKEIILNSFESPDILHLFERLKTIEEENYLSLIKQSEEDGVLDIPFRNELQKSINELLPKLSDTLMDVKIQNFNFMNSVNNTNLTITLRNQHYSISRYYQEKGSILANIRHLLKDYLNNGFNKLSLNKIDDFQIEIYESEEIHKKVIMKKESNLLLLYSSFGFSYSNQFDYNLGGEFYYSIGDDFSFFKNKQSHALIREHGKIVEREINSMDKILTNNELMIINDLTKDINDAVIEIYFNSKGGVKILNVSLIENQLFKKSENGFIINKSSKNYDKITTINLRDNFSDESPNPKYLVIRNFSEVKELISKLKNLEDFNFIDGIIFNFNFYSPIFDYIFRKIDLDILYYNKQIPKLLDLKIDFNNVLIEFNENNSKSSQNPFTNILGDLNKKEDELLDKLKNIDLSTPNPAQRGNGLNQNNEINNLTESILSSSNSSINNSSNSFSNSSSKEKKSAIDFLVETAMKGPKNEDKKIKENEQEEIGNKYLNNENKSPFDDFSKYDNENQNKESFENRTESEESNEINNILNHGDINSNNEGIIEEDVNLSDNENLTLNNLEKSDIERYNNILATTILTSPEINSENYFVDINSFNNISDYDSQIYFLTNDISNIKNGNSNIKYILPLDLFETELNSKIDYILINSLEDFFLVSPEIIIDQNQNFFVNLTKINKSLRKKFLNESIDKFGPISVIILKEDIDLIEKKINMVENIMIRDLNDLDEYKKFREKILVFEKRYLLENY